MNIDPDVEETAGTADAEMSFEEPGDAVVADMLQNSVLLLQDMSVAEHGGAAVADTKFANN